MKVPVLIVAKTHMHDLACVGGLRLDTNQNVRLLQADASYQPGDTDYEVGQHWELDIEQYRATQPPHVESVLVFRRRLIGQQHNLHRFLIERIQPWHGAPDALFDGYLRATPEGSGYIARGSKLPKGSTGFWIPDRPLQHVQSDRRLRLKYPQSAGIRILPYVGYAPLIDTIPAGTLVRVSLARWWRPDKNSEIEERCYLQLSGWFEPNPSGSIDSRPSPEPKQLGLKSKHILTRMSEGYTFEQILNTEPKISSEDLASAAREALILLEAADEKPRQTLVDRQRDHPRAYEKWTEEEDEALRQLVHAGEHIDDIAPLLQRHKGAIRSRIIRLHLEQEYQRHH